MNKLNYSGNLTVINKKIDLAVTGKLKIEMKEMNDITHVHFPEIINEVMSFYSSVEANENNYKCTYFVHLDNETYVGEYTLDIIHTESLLPTIIDFAVIVSERINKDMIFEIAQEIAILTKQAAMELDDLKITVIKALKVGENTITSQTSRVVLLDQDFIIQEKIDELKVN